MAGVGLFSRLGLSSATMWGMDLGRRERQRAWRRGSLADDLVFLQAQLRAGELPRPESAGRVLGRLLAGELAWDRVELAAYLGDPLGVAMTGAEELVALAAYLGESGAVDVVLGCDPDWDDLRVWAVGLAHWGRSAALRPVLAVSQALVDLLAAEEIDPADGEDPDYHDYYRETNLASARESLEGVQRWLDAGVGGRPAEVQETGYGWGSAVRDVASGVVRVARAPGRVILEEALAGWAVEVAQGLVPPSGVLEAARGALPWVLEET